MIRDKIKKPVGRPKNKVDNRAKLIKAAQLLFVSNDYDKVSIRAIARQAEVDPGLIRYYFQSKLGLFSAMISETAEPVTKQLKTMSLKLNKSSPEALMQTYYQVMSKNPHFPKLIFRILSMKATAINPQLKMILNNIFQTQNFNMFNQLKKDNYLQTDVDPVCANLSFFSMMIFPFLMPELIKSILGISITPEFMQHLSRQNSHLLCHGLLTKQTKDTEQ